MTHREADFDRLSWHDCCMWAIELRPGDPDEDDWTSDLALDIDFILEWLSGMGTDLRFRVAPATLLFHDVTDLKIAIDCGISGFQTTLQPPSIATIEREAVQDQKVCLDRPYYKWRICLDSEVGEITFGATGFTQTLRAEPILTNRQCLSLKERGVLKDQ